MQLIRGIVLVAFLATSSLAVSHHHISCDHNHNGLDSKHSVSEAASCSICSFLGSYKSYSLGKIKYQTPEAIIVSLEFRKGSVILVSKQVRPALARAPPVSA